MELKNRKQNRLPEYKYNTPNAYFITICTKDRTPLFWSDVGAIIDRPKCIPLTDLGQVTEQTIRCIPEHYPSVSINHYAVMPDHVHLLLQIHADKNGLSLTAPTISTIIRMMKGIVSKHAGFSVWQKGFHEHVVRGSADYREIQQYIENNPAAWINKIQER